MSSLRNFLGFPALLVLRINDIKISDEGVEHLVQSSCRQILELSLNENKISDCCIKHLQGILVHVYISP